MNVLAIGLVVGAFVVAVALVLPAIRRTGLGVWHPAIAWLVLNGVFFGVGSIRLAIDGRNGPAFYVAGCTLALAVAVAISDRVARRRASTTSRRRTPPNPTGTRRRGAPRSRSAWPCWDSC